MAMKWILLDGKKDPPSDQQLGIWVPMDDIKNKGYFTKGTLSRIEFLGSTKNYVFEETNSEGMLVEPSHYMIIEPPKKINE